MALAKMTSHVVDVIGLARAALRFDRRVAAHRVVGAGSANALACGGSQ